MLGGETVPTLSVHHSKKHGYGAGSACGSTLSGIAFFIYLLKSLKELLESSVGYRISQKKVRSLGILIGWVVGEVRTDYEQVIFVEIWLKDLRYALQNAEPLGSDNYWDYGRHIPENHLQEWNLDFQAMFVVMGSITP